VTAFMSTLQAVHGTAPDPPHSGSDIEAVAGDGARRKVPLASACRTAVKPGPGREREHEGLQGDTRCSRAIRL
jgi:hypothetical protein